MKLNTFVSPISKLPPQRKGFVIAKLTAAIIVCTFSQSFAASGYLGKISSNKIFSPTINVGQISVSGQVLDNKNLPLPGVSVMLKGGKAVTVTDNAGKFKIDVPDKNAILVFSFIGFEKKELPVTPNSPMLIKMDPNMSELNAVVVVGYGTQKKGSLTSSITTVNTALLENRAVTQLSTALAGITPGVAIRQQSGRPGSTATIDIRGGSLQTFSANPPLVIIDGIVDDLNNINPNDVASISVLKDASAAAIDGLTDDHCCRERSGWLAAFRRTEFSAAFQKCPSTYGGHS